MTNLEARYKNWSEAAFKAFLESDVGAQVSIWAEGCTRTAIDAFGEHAVIHGQDAIREAAKNWASAKKRLQSLQLAVPFFYITILQWIAR